MKRIYTLFIICSLTVGSWAQTQQGVVKTKGRMVNGKHVAGQGLSGATVTILGRNAVQSQTNGGFSFPIPNKTFMLQGVQKNGYQLVDPDATRKAYQYSPNTFYIVMETPDQQSEDKLAAERKIRRTLQRQLQQREDELEELKAQNKLTQEEYRKAMQQLYNDQQNNEKLIADMAKEYAEMDYDQMDELNRQISDAILNGELTKADSLLRTKGDVNSRIAEVRKAQRAEAQEEAKLAQRQENLPASKEGTKKRLEDLAQDCKNYFDRFKISNQHDSAAYYIELRVELDTTRAEWSYAAGNFNQWYMENHSKAINYYQRSLRIELSKGEAGQRAVAAIYYNMGCIYMIQHKLSESFEYHKKALEIRRKLLGDSATVTALSYSRVGRVYQEMGDLSKSMEYFTKSLKIGEINSDSGLIAAAYCALGNVYYIKNDLKNAWIYYNKSLKYHENGDSLYMTETYHGIEKIFVKQNKFSEALDVCHKILNIYQKEYGIHHSSVASCYSEMGYIYTCMGNIPIALKYLHEALKIDEDIYGKNSVDIASDIDNIGYAYREKEDYNQALLYYKRAMELLDTMPNDDGINSNRINNLKSISLIHIGDVYSMQGKYKLSSDCYEKSLCLKRNLYDEKHSEIADLYCRIGQNYYNQDRLQKAIEYYNKALDIQYAIYGKRHSEVANTYMLLGTTNHKLGNKSVALDYLFDAVNTLKSVLGTEDVNQARCYMHIANINSENDSLYLAYRLKALKIQKEVLSERNIEMAHNLVSISLRYLQMNDIENALKYAQEGMSIEKEIYGDLHSEIADMYLIYGIASGSRNEHEQAINYFLKRLDIETKLYGENSFVLAYTYSTIATEYQNTGDYKKAGDYYEKALSIQKDSLGEKHEKNISLYNNLGDVYYHQELFEKAIEKYQKALDIQKALREDDDIEVARNYIKIGRILVEKNGDYVKAVEYCKKALIVGAPILGENNYEVAESYKYLGYSYWGIGDSISAIKSFEQMLNICIAINGENHISVAEVCTGLGNLYYERNDFIQAVDNYEKVIKILEQTSLEEENAISNYADLCNKIGTVYYRLNEFERSEYAFGKSLDLYRSLYNDHKDEYYEQFLNVLFSSGGVFALNKKYDKAYLINKELISYVIKEYKNAPSQIADTYSECLNNQSYYAIMLKKYTEAEQYAREGLQIDSTKHILFTNLAAALLFQGKYAEAEKIYRQYKEELKESFLGDFKQFAEAGVIPKEYEVDVEKIKQMLNK